MTLYAGRPSARGGKRLPSQWVRDRPIPRGRLPPGSTTPLCGRTEQSGWRRAWAGRRDDTAQTDFYDFGRFGRIIPLEATLTDTVHDVVNRRQAATLFGAALTTFGLFRSDRAAASALVVPQTASRLPPIYEQYYEPPTSLSAVVDIYRRMTVPIGVGGAGPFAFVVDTGANQSVISQELVTRLGLKIGPPESLNGVAGVQMEPTTITDLHISGRIETGVVMSVLPAKDIGGDGMLGLDRLEGRELTLDFGGRALRIAVSQQVRRDPGIIAVKARRRDGQLTLVDADLAGIPLVAFLDSGAQNTIGNRALRARALARNSSSRWTETPIVSVTGQTILAEMADLPHLRIGGLRLPNWPVAFADLHTFHMWNMIDRPAILIGVDILSRFQTVCLDFARNEVRFRLPDQAW